MVLNKRHAVNFFISSCAGRKICILELFSYVRFNVYLVLRETVCDFFLDCCHYCLVVDYLLTTKPESPILSFVLFSVRSNVISSITQKTV